LPVIKSDSALRGEWKKFSVVAALVPRARMTELAIQAAIKFTENPAALAAPRLPALFLGALL